MTASGRATILRADAANLPLPDGSVDLVVTSPPYWSLRSYEDGGEHYAGQIGSEATPVEFVDALIACTKEWARVLKPGGSIWVNLGDKYSTGNSGQSGMAALGARFAGGGHSDAKAKRRSGAVAGMRPKSLLGLPWRYAIRCTDDLGLILRAEVIWSKPNALPESVTDRVRRSHEQWFHLVKQPTYFTAIDEIRQAHVSKPSDRGANCLAGQRALKPSGPNSGAYNPVGALPGSVWEVASEPLTAPDHLGVDHFAAFPTELPRRIILGWSPSGVCDACGEGRRPLVDRGPARGDFNGDRRDPAAGRTNNGAERKRVYLERLAAGIGRRVVGDQCACPDTSAPTRPAVVLDPFGGTGTTALVAKAFGRHGISVDRSADYCRLATWRVNDPGQLAKAMRVPAPPKVDDSQQSLDLFGDVA